MLSARDIDKGSICLGGGRRIADDDFLIEDARTQVRPGDVLLTIVGSIGRVAVVPEGAPKFALQRSVAVLKPGLSISSRYLAYGLEAGEAQQWLQTNAKGTAQKGVYLGVIAELPLHLAPTTEQLRIVKRLDELLSDLDAGLVELKAAEAKLQAYRQSILKAAMEGELTANWRSAHPTSESGNELLQRILTERKSRWEIRQRERASSSGKPLPKNWQSSYAGPAEVDATELPPLPQHWTWATLDMLGEIASGVAKGGKVGADAKLREVPYLRVANVQRGYLDLNEVKTILASETDIEQLALRDGDVLFNEGGDRDKLGRGWVWRSQVPECIHQNHVFRMRPFLPDMNSEFISHHGNSFGQQWFLAVGKQTTNLASINMGMLRAFPVPVPPAAEQARIAQVVSESLEAADAMKASIDKALAQCAAQRQKILHAAFSGQLVPQDPADEPADALLARIRASRSVAKPPARRQRAAASSAAAN